MTVGLPTQIKHRTEKFLELRRFRPGSKAAFVPAAQPLASDQNARARRIDPVASRRNNGWHAQYRGDRSRRWLAPAAALLSPQRRLAHGDSRTRAAAQFDEALLRNSPIALAARASVPPVRPNLKPRSRFRCK